MLHRGSSLSQTRHFLSVRLMVVRAGVQSVAASCLMSRILWSREHVAYRKAYNRTVVRYIGTVSV